MKNYIKFIAVMAMINLSATIIAQDTSEIPESIDFLQPYDREGNNWFVSLQDKRDFFNSMIENAHNDASDNFISFKKDIFFVSVRLDNDHNHDNGGVSYHQEFIFSNNTGTNTSQEITINSDDNYETFTYVGENMKNASLSLAGEESTLFHSVQEPSGWHKLLNIILDSALVISCELIMAAEGEDDQIVGAIPLEDVQNGLRMYNEEGAMSTLISVTLDGD